MTSRQSLLSELPSRTDTTHNPPRLTRSLRSPRMFMREFAQQTFEDQRELIVEMQSLGLRMTEGTEEAPSRRGGAGPSDHKAVLIGDTAVMVPIHTGSASRSPFSASSPGSDGLRILARDGVAVGSLGFPKQPRFYSLQTLDG